MPYYYIMFNHVSAYNFYQHLITNRITIDYIKLRPENMSKYLMYDIRIINNNRIKIDTMTML